VTPVLSELSSSARSMILQAVCGHHGEPIAFDASGRVRDIRNEGKQIGARGKDAA